MKTRFLTFWEKLRATYWVLPTVMLVAAIALSLTTVVLDRLIQIQTMPLFDWLNVGGAEGTRTLLSTIAGSMITIAGVAFSVIIVAFTLASSQFGPRILSNFMRDRGNQFVLGTFIATFIYCLLVLRTIENEADSRFIPHLSVFTALLLTIASLGVLIYFIHHAAISIQANHIIAEIGRELDDAIMRLFPEKTWRLTLEQDLRSEEDVPPDFEEKVRPISANQSGYLQAVDYDGLVDMAVEKGIILRLEHRPGDFITQGSKLVLAYPSENVDDESIDQINDAIILGPQRQRLQDVEFAVNQLVEIAVRALSPGINDPFTAVSCIDQLEASLVRLAERSIPSGYLYDDGDQLRLLTNAVTFVGLTETAFNQIRQYGRSSTAVSIRLLESIATIVTKTEDDLYRAALLRQAVIIRESSQTAFPAKYDRQTIEKRYELVREALDSS